MTEPLYYLIISNGGDKRIPISNVIMGSLLSPTDTEDFSLFGESLSDYNVFQTRDLSTEANSYSMKSSYTFSAKLYDENNELVCEFINAMPTGVYSILGQEQAHILVDYVRYNTSNKFGALLSEEHARNVAHAMIVAKEKSPITTFYFPENF